MPKSGVVVVPPLTQERFHGCADISALLLVQSSAARLPTPWPAACLPTRLSASLLAHLTVCWVWLPQCVPGRLPLSIVS